MAKEHGAYGMTRTPRLRALLRRDFSQQCGGCRPPGTSDYPSGKEGDVLTVEFTVAGVPCISLNGGPVFKHSEAFSFQIAGDQQETDPYWNAIVGNGGQGEPVRLVQRQVGRLLANHAARADRCAGRRRR